MAVRYVIGDATRPKTNRPAVIAHVCNDIGAWGAGFSGAISDRWMAPEVEYRRWHAGRDDGFALGAVQFVRVERKVAVANMVAQHGVGRARGVPIRYDALGECLATVGRFARSEGSGVHMPRIGCGLAGGTWDRVGVIVERELEGVEVTVYYVDHGRLPRRLEGGN